MSNPPPWHNPYPIMNEDDTFAALKHGRVSISFDTSLAGDCLEEVETRLNAFSYEYWNLKEFPTEQHPVYMAVGRDLLHVMIMLGIELDVHRRELDKLIPFMINYEFK